MASLLAALVSQWWISRHSKEERHAPTNILCEHKFACKRYSFSFYSFIYYLSTIAMQFSGHMWPSLEGWLQVIRALHVGFYPAYRIWLLPLSRLPEGKTRQEPQTGWSTLTGLRIPSFDTGVGEGGCDEDGIRTHFMHPGEEFLHRTTSQQASLLTWKSGRLSDLKTTSLRFFFH